MKKEQILDNLEKLLMAIHREVVIIRDADSKLPKHEMDKTLSNIRALYEQFTVLNYLNTHGVELSLTEVEANQIPSLKQKPDVNSVAKIEEKNHTPFEPIVESIKHEPEIIISSVTEIPEPHLVNEEPHKETIDTVLSAPSLKQESSSVRELTVGDKLRLQKIEDLNKGISMAEKFLYMNDLFKGENGAFKEAIDVINLLQSEEDAERYLNGLSKTYGWEENPKTEKKFRELVARKFQ